MNPEYNLILIDIIGWYLIFSLTSHTSSILEVKTIKNHRNDVGKKKQTSSNSGESLFEL